MTREHRHLSGVRGQGGGQLLRLAEYRAAHPQVRIVPIREANLVWQARMPSASGGEHIVTRYELGALLDKLDAIDEAAEEEGR